jgi:hypothetical protein
MDLYRQFQNGDFPAEELEQYRKEYPELFDIDGKLRNSEPSVF